MQWSLTLFKYNFTIFHISEKMNKHADILSQQKQNMSKNADTRINDCMIQLYKSQMLAINELSTIYASSVYINEDELLSLKKL